jgi:hypothetical protein
MGEDWFAAQLRYYQRVLYEGGDPAELREALAARRDTCMERLLDAVMELRELHGVSEDELVEAARLAWRATEAAPPCDPV